MAKTQTECDGEPEFIWLVTFSHEAWDSFTRAYFTLRGVKSAISQHKKFDTKIRRIKVDDMTILD